MPAEHGPNDQETSVTNWGIGANIQTKLINPNGEVFLHRVGPDDLGFSGKCFVSNQILYSFAIIRLFIGFNYIQTRIRNVSLETKGRVKDVFSSEWEKGNLFSTANVLY